MSPISPTAALRAAKLTMAVALTVLAVGCASSFRFETPEGHPADPEAPAAAALAAPSPYDPVFEGDRLPATGSGASRPESHPGGGMEEEQR